MRCLVDADLLLWECSFAGQFKDEETGEVVMLDFDKVQELFDQRIREIEDACWSNEPSTLYFTADERLMKMVNKQRVRDGKDRLEYRPNFRMALAKARPYKARTNTRPLHYYNLRAYAIHAYEVVVANGMEADDRLAMDQDQVGLTTIICSRDKDLKQVPGMLYSWECGGQPGWGPTNISRIGALELPKPTKVVGCGLKWFYAQVVTGDAVDTIPGLPRGGPTLAYNTLKDCETEEEMYGAVKALYEHRLGEDYESYLEEQINLLWMVREVDEEGNPVLYRAPRESV